VVSSLVQTVTELVYARSQARAGVNPGRNHMPSVSGRYRATDLQRVEAQYRTAVGRLVMPHGWMSADDKRWLLERFPELAATLALPGPV